MAAPILQMEKHVLDQEVVEQLVTEYHVLLEARSQPEEAREALRWMKRSTSVRAFLSINVQFTRLI